MDKSKKHIYNEHNGLYYMLIADYLSGLSNLPYAPIPPESWQRRFPTAYNCDNSQKFSLKVVKSVRIGYNY